MDGAEEGMPSTGAGSSMSYKACVDGINKSLQHPTVRFLREKMEQAGCPVWGRLLMGITCKGQTSAVVFNTLLFRVVIKKFKNGNKAKITICCNHMSFQNEIDQVIIHELIHAYDDCRAKNLDWTNCAHHACSEIRANHLSGDCHYKRELLRGFLKIRGHEQSLGCWDIKQ
ncbi:hypothetical protein ZIOFF_015423 [Zingiber officinale]|uniref:Mitochondrial inner membrane protease ATP23 n=1 Tax=Zingiber officinale TaxID=94328 RepID=A0A8J5LMF1_ZINOF|nr:hypothetical protein ZIOFF_015423 [Zingiber officinale]